ncbi:hypothetical protein [Enterobacter hormaechei]|uniref:hypothetical protein n=1 Tax=Enterobacter hormaechei TaxID=158836 RepID=UPI0012540D0F|nr:hypothetical protein [Enterobacter hormaechei]MCU3029431.1 hypothetical protein [Enterobacter hormaechei subsp. hoffmannii]CAF3231900.1 hypothetical protein AI3013V2_2147 [Enterobacter cloacae]EKS6325544.1 hypothetical protein [Enterobacter hormaechei]QMI59114.1 hypothetical protein H1D58_12900 [Enterobacter hormaechei]CAH5662226.1 hypothetical protein AI3013V2_2147 [Enterobacter cloacae]
MTVKNQELIAAGFTSKDIERIKRHQATGESQEKVLKDLAGYFLSVAWITGGMAIITLFTECFLESPDVSCSVHSFHKLWRT